MPKIRNIRAWLMIGVLAGLIAAAVQVVGTTAASSTAAAAQELPGTASPPAGPELTLAQVQAAALKFAAIAHEPNPTAVSVARGSFADAQALVDGNAGADTSPAAGTAGAAASEPVFLVVMHGDFTLNAPRPKGAAEPAGSVMGLILDAHTGFPEGRYVGVEEPQLKALGPVTQLVEQ